MNLLKPNRGEKTIGEMIWDIDEFMQSKGPIEDIYIINLSARKDRWDNVTKEVSKSKLLNPIRFEAVRSHNGANGCALSHISIIEMAKAKSLPYVIVWEDDTEIRSKCFDQILLRILGYLKSHSDWEIFNGNPANLAHKNNQPVTVLYPYPAIVSYKFSTSTNFMIYSSRSYNQMISYKEQYLQNSGTPIDMLISEKFRFITSVPYLTRQLDGYSDIASRNTQYDCYIIDKGEAFIKNHIQSSYIGGHLIGGLGNQMFIMAAAFCMAAKHGCILTLDKHNHCPNGSRKYNEYWDTYFNFIDFAVPFTGADRTEGEGAEFMYRDVPKSANRINLTGYFQHAGFFNNMREDIRRFFMPEPQLLSQLKLKYPWTIIKDRTKVSVHIRRGDYVSLKHIHHNVPVTYYTKCCNIIETKFSNPLFIVFSDDIPWCQQNIKGDIYITDERDHHELILMSMCDVHVIANSTFSWWGAYLSGNNNVYAPCRWMEGSRYPEGLILPGWQKIEY